MKILVHDYSGHPFQVQLSRHLAARGHSVLHLHCPSYKSGKGDLARRAGDPDRFQIDAVDLGEDFDKYSPARRLVQERRYARRFVGRAQSFGADVLLSGNCPLFAHRRIQAWSRRLRVPFVFWQQDIYSLAMAQEVRRRVPVLGAALGRRFVSMEAALARQSSAVVCISDDFVPVLTQWGVRHEDIAVIENWAPLEEVPARPKVNAWSTGHGLDSGVNLVYAGTIGLKHDPELLADVAAACQAAPRASVVVVSEGPGADWIRQAALDRGLTNLTVLGFQPYELLPDVLAAGDILLLVLEPDAGVFSVPSKMLTYLCAGRPIVASVPPENLAARIVTRSGAGVVVRPGDGAEFTAAAVGLVGDAVGRERMGRAARAYAERTFDVDTVTDAFEALLDRATGGRLFTRTRGSAPAGGAGSR